MFTGNPAFCLEDMMDICIAGSQRTKGHNYTTILGAALFPQGLTMEAHIHTKANTVPIIYILI